MTQLSTLYQYLRRKHINMFLCLAVCFPYISHAENVAGDAYQVEVLLFRYNKAFTATRETWPQKIDRFLPANAFIPGTSGTQTPGSPFVFLDQNHYTFKHYLSALQRAEGVRTLYHIAWQQHRNTGIESRPLWIQGGNINPEGQYELEGSISLSINNDIVVSTDLLLAEYALADASTTNNSTAPNSSQTPLNTNENKPETRDPSAPRYVTSHVARMQENRQLKLNELHYFDHPLFGLLIRVTRQ